MQRALQSERNNKPISPTINVDHEEEYYATLVALHDSCTKLVQSSIQLQQQDNIRLLIVRFYEFIY